MSEENKSLSQIINYRIEKLSKLKEMGFEPYPHKYDRTHSSTEILNNFENLEDKDVSISGRVMALRKMKYHLSILWMHLVRFRFL